MISRVTKYIVAALLCLLPMIAGAQELKVESFTEATMDIMDVSMQKRDYNNDICAIVKVLLPLEGAEFEGAFDYSFHTSEYWVYMSPGKKMLRVKCPGRLPLMVHIDDYIGSGVRAKTIYELLLSGYPVVETIHAQGTTMPVGEKETSHYLVLKVTPHNADVKIDGVGKQLDSNGEGSFYLEEGTHTYSVTATGYAPQTETVELTEKLTRNISLESVMATLTLTCATPGVSFYVNDQQKGTGNWTGKLLADTYRVDARKDGHKSRSQTVTLSERDNQTVSFPALEEITGRLNVDYKPIDSEVWIDGKRAGSSPDVFTVMVGSHSVEIKKDGYVAHKESVNIEENKEAPVLEGTLEKGNAKINGHEYVDLGLSVKWATCNVGASQPEQYGHYYAWGETKTKAEYTIKNSKTRKTNIGDIKGTSRDVAYVKWGGTWRMPTEAEFQELMDNCDYEWTTLNGVKGGNFTSKKNGKSIFLPAAGWRYGTSLGDAGSSGYYWSSTPYESNTQGAYDLYFDSFSHDWFWGGRYDGQSVRPVSE